MKDDSLSDVQAYGTSKDLTRRINKSYKELFGSDQSKLGFGSDSVGKQDNVYAKQIWNDAIEAAMEKFKTQFVASEVIIKMLKELKK